MANCPQEFVFLPVMVVGDDTVDPNTLHPFDVLELSRAVAESEMIQRISGILIMMQCCVNEN